MARRPFLLAGVRRLTGQQPICPTLPARSELPSAVSERCRARPARWLAERKLATEQVPIHVADTLTPDEVRGYEGNRFFGTDVPITCGVVTSQGEAAQFAELKIRNCNNLDLTNGT